MPDSIKPVLLLTVVICRFDGRLLFDNRIMPEMAARALRFRFPQREDQVCDGGFARGSID
jgi:hypothetical protein